MKVQILLVVLAMTFGRSWCVGGGGGGGSSGQHCMMEHCYNGATCTTSFSFPFYKCTCAPGYEGSKCSERSQTSTKHCSSSPCQHGGTCREMDRNPHYHCACRTGYSGYTCDQQTNHCDSNPCHNHGVCSYTGHYPHYSCQCSHGYTGFQCDQRVNHCDSRPCHNGGSCTETIHHPHYSCQCPSGYSGNECDRVETSTTTATMRTTTRAPPVPTTAVPQILETFMCDKYSSVLAVAQKVISSDQLASLCLSGDHASPEAYVLKHCNATAPAMWKGGRKVMDNCASVPHYTPVFSVIDNKYHFSNGLAGIFIECTHNPDGFKMAVQSCDHAPVVTYITTGGALTRSDPFVYYTIA